jgi:hypothetical protein
MTRGPARPSPILATLSALVATVVGCGVFPASHRGRYSVGFEKREFVPCGSRERWWATGPLAASLAATIPGERGEGTIFVEWSGTKSPRGHYGHLGQYDREFTVQNVVRTRAPGPDDCR